MRPDLIAESTQPDSTRRFPRAARVRVRSEFAQVFEHARRVAHPLMILHWLPDANPARLGLAVSRKVDPRAVGRNRIKRALREEFRHLRSQLACGACVVVVRSAAKTSDNRQLRDCFATLLQRCGALPPSAPTGTMPTPHPRAD